jgi:hypothetical protein
MPVVVTKEVVVEERSLTAQVRHPGFQVGRATGRTNSRLLGMGIDL